jgi:hypothetical protein
MPSFFNDTMIDEIKDCFSGAKTPIRCSLDIDLDSHTSQRDMILLPEEESDRLILFIW